MISKNKYCPKCEKYISTNDECMFCHIVPKTYQKKWSKPGTKANIYYFDKSLNPVTKNDKNGESYDVINGGKADNFMGEWDYYILTEYDQKYINGTPRCIENFFDKEIENLWSGVYELFIEGNLDKNKPTVKKKYLHLYTIIGKNGTRIQTKLFQRLLVRILMDCSFYLTKLISLFGYNMFVNSKICIRILLNPVKS